MPNRHEDLENRIPKPAAEYSPWDRERKYGDFQERRHEQRSNFEVDKARIVHSAAFRCLQGKTQVVSLGQGDFYRTRLTHTLEVAQLGRGLCQEIHSEFVPDQDLVEAICLAHDIGHPPFGHAGERLLNELMWEHGGFSANAQNLRTVTLIENKHPEGGLNLTRATLDGLIKYPITSDGRQDFKRNPNFIYAGDAGLVEWVKNGRKALPVEGQIADWVDEVAYCVDDIEDSFRTGLLSFTRMKEMAREIAEEASRKCEIPISPAEVVKLADSLHFDLAVSPSSHRERQRVLKEWASSTMHGLLRGCKIVERMSNEDSYRYKYGLEIPVSSRKNAAVLASTAAKLVFADDRIRRMEHKAVRILRRLFERISHRDSTGYLVGKNLLPPDFQELVKAVEGSIDSENRVLADFVAGMTEQFATTYLRWLMNPQKRFPGYLGD